MNILMKKIRAEWHYVENGIPFQRIQKMEEDNITVYPGSNDKSSSPDEVFTLAKELKPDLILLHEDVNNITKYLKPNKFEGMCWFPYDLDFAVSSLSELMNRASFIRWHPVCISVSTQMLLEDMGYECDQLYNMANEEAFCPLTGNETEDYRQEFFRNIGVPREKWGRFILLYVGRLSGRKNIEGLYGMVQELMKIRKDFFLVIHGDTNDPGRTCDHLVEVMTRGISDHVIFDQTSAYARNVDDKELNKLYNMADLYVSASTGEGFGIPIVEAGLCQKPFVITEGTTSWEFSQRHAHGIPVPYSKDTRNYGRVDRPMPDHVEMAKIIDMLLTQEDRRIKMGEDFRKWVMLNCSVDVVIKKFERLIDMHYCKEVKLA